MSLLFAQCVPSTKRFGSQLYLNKIGIMLKLAYLGQL